MTDLNLSRTTTTGMNSAVTNYAVSSKIIDEPSKTEETVWENPNWSKYLGYYKQIPEFKEAIRALANWAVGKGYVTGPEEQVILEHIRGAGEDSFQSIMTNHIIVKKVNGDAYAEIIKDDKTGILINLKPLNPATMRTVFNKKGLIVRYEEFDPSSKGKEAVRKFEVKDILHSMNDRVANETHGTSVLEACQWVIDARNEAMADKRRVHHRSTIRIMEVDADDTSKLNSLKTQYADAIKNGEVLIVPKGDVSFPNAPINYIDTLDWIRYLEGFFYQAVGVPKIILGGADQISEGSNKMSSYNFEQVYMTEQTLLEQDIWNQLHMRVTFERPASLQDNMQSNEAKNTSQTGFQSKDFSVTGGRE